MGHRPNNSFKPKPLRGSASSGVRPMEVDKLASPVTYPCPSEREDVALSTLWFLGTYQGAEGQLSPMSTRVICSRASTCESLANDRCPLTVGYGEVMNQLEVHVMHNLPVYSIGE